jgi:fibro-slime domain-containing protein
MKPIIRSAVLLSLVLLSALFQAPRAQGYLLPDTLWARVLFYDFHANGTNPNFEACNPGFQPGMIQDYLDANRKPVFKADKACNTHVDQWFRPSNLVPANVKFVYDTLNARWYWSGVQASRIDSRGWEAPTWLAAPPANPRDSMSNIVFYDSLPFTLQDSATGTYFFNRTASNPDAAKRQFFWLDGKGFGTEPSGSGHNFAFTMEMHKIFTYKGGEFFNFSGDDDVWVFINGKLVIDLGGVHSSKSASVRLDSIATQLGIVKGRTYWFDFFYAERHTSQANCLITTNILTPTKPNHIVITTDPAPPDSADTTRHNTTITAGNCITWHAWIFDDTGGLRHDWDTLVHWTVVDTMGNPVAIDTISDTNTICLIKAHGCVKIYFTFTNPSFPDIKLIDSVIICINPAAPHHLNIEANPDLSGTSHQDRPLDSTTIAASASQTSVYAIIRDQYGNFIKHAQQLAWTVLPIDDVVRDSTGNPSRGEGIIKKKGPPGSDNVMVTTGEYAGALFRDTVKVKVSQTQYTQVRIAVGQGGQRTAISSLTIKTSRDTVLYAEALRTDGLGWELVNATWGISGVTARTVPPPSASSWDFQPATSGSGNISVTYGSLTRSIPLTAIPGGPVSIDVYPDTGRPGPAYGNVNYGSPPTINVYAAGSNISLVAKVFDGASPPVWLDNYQRDPAKASLFTWQARSKSGAQIDSTVGAFSTATGPVSSFVPRKAGDTVDLIVSFAEGPVSLSDTVRIRITVGAPNHLSIEPVAGSQSPNRDNPIDRIEFLATDTTQKVYAVIRDAFGNYIGAATQAAWTTGNGLVATVNGGSQGTGTIRRIADTLSQTWIYATNTGFSDSVRVVINDITYTQLRLVVNSNGFRDIDTLVQRTDQDTTLLALGRRSDNNQWVLVGVTWQIASLNGVTPPSTSVDRWALRPTVADTGIIRIVKGTAADSIRAIFRLGLPASLVLYRKDLSPADPQNAAYPGANVVDTLTAGVDTGIVAYLFDVNNMWLSSFKRSDAPISWSIREISGSGSSGTLSASTGYKTIFRPRRAYNTVEIVAVYSENGTTISRAVRFYIKAGMQTHLVIEASPLASSSPNSDNPLAGITIGSGDTLAYAYAILRDALGNFVSASPATNWTSLSTAVVTVAEGVAALGEGLIVRSALSGSTSVIARNRANGALADTVAVSLSQVQYDSLRLVVNSNGLKHIDSLVIRTDQDTTLFAIGKRSDNGQWDNVRVRWTSTGIIVAPAAPVQTADRWQFRPDSAKTGRIVISTTGRNGAALYDSISVRCLPGLPAKLVLYPRDGQPSVNNNFPYPSIATVQSLAAGTAFPAAAKMFDGRDAWLNQYDNSSAPINWRIIEVSGNPPTGTLSPAAGNKTAFTPLRAYNTVYLVAEFRSGAIVLSDTVALAVVASAASHLVLEASPDRNVSPNADNPVYAITLSSKDTAASVYAVLRDRFGNFSGYSRNNLWTSIDTSVVLAEEGIVDVGEGRAIRKKNSGETQIAVVNQDNPSWTDTVTITLSSITYGALRIVVNDRGLKDIDTLVMRTDQDTTLLALGQRSDNSLWDNLRVQWQSTGLSLSPQAPFGDQWRFTPTATGSGVINASASGTSGQITDRVIVQFLPGLPRKVVIYPREGTPGVNNNLPYPSSNEADTIAAGDSALLVAKLFDRNDVWLSSYERSTAPIQWRLVEVSGNPPTGTLLPASGHRSILVPLRAYNTILAIAEYQAGSSVYSDTVRFCVKPSAPSHLVIEASPSYMASPNADNPAGGITISSRDTVANVYAVYRDRFGNFVDYARTVNWTSLDTLVVAAGPGITAIGEGRIVRAAGAGGSTLVIGESRTYPGMRDTVTVTLATISYDSLRIVAGNNTPISTLTMRTDQDTTLSVQGKRSDNGQWEYVPAQWTISAGLSTNPAAPTGADNWKFSPTDTGSGWIRAGLGSTPPDTVRVMFLPGKPARLSLYPKSGAPGADNAPYASPPTAVEVTAGDSVRVSAKLFDGRNVWLGDTTAAFRIIEISGTPPTGVLTSTSGRTTVYVPIKAYSTVYLVAAFTNGVREFLDTLYISVKAGTAHHLVIEPDQNWLSHPNSDNPIDTITITNIDTLQHIYAIVRDVLGNFVGYSQRTGWSSLDTSIVAVQNGISGIGEGIVRKTFALKKDTLTRVAAASRDFAGLTDTAAVEVLNIHFRALRIVVGDTTHISSLVMTTDADTTLRVQGQRSDNLTWVDVKAKWTVSSGLPVLPDPPEKATLWRFSPTLPDSSHGFIAVTLESDSTRPDTVRVTFTRSPPRFVEIELLTPSDQRIAGDTIVAVVRVKNTDGLVPGAYCSPGLYQDQLGWAGRDSLPKVIVDGQSDTLRQRSAAPDPVSECFTDGVDTVRFVLYYAPHSDDPDSMHRLFVTVNGVQAFTPGFALLPDTLARIAIENTGKKPMPDTLLHAPDDFLFAYAMGYDRFGNKLGPLESDWRIISGDLHAIARPDKTDRLYYTTRDVLFDESGCIVARVFGHAAIADTVCLSIKAPPADIRTAITHDYSGNGYLDHIELHFTKPVTFDSANITISLRYNDIAWIVDSIGRSSTRDTVFIVRLREDTGAGDPQTNWTPAITIEGIPESDTLAPTAVCADGAGPVIWRVVKEIVDLGDRTKDIITVIFSENIQGGDGGSFKLTNPPDSVFMVWMKNADSQFVPLPRFLDSIGGFLTVRQLDRLRFVMENGNELLSTHWFSIRVDTTANLINHYVIDRSARANRPEIDNQKVKVYVEPAKPKILKSAPNPAIPAPQLAPLSALHDGQARQRVTTVGGTVLSFPLLFEAGARPEKVDAHIKIYDMVGNLVAFDDEYDILASGKIPDYFAKEGGMHEYDIYWDCTNSRGMRVAPGVYRATVYLDFAGTNVQDKMFVSTIGVGR